MFSLYISNSINCISAIQSTVFLLFCQLYFSNSVNCISQRGNSQPTGSLPSSSSDSAAPPSQFGSNPDLIPDKTCEFVLILFVVFYKYGFKSLDPTLILDKTCECQLNFHTAHPKKIYCLFRKSKFNVCLCAVTTISALILYLYL